MAQRDELPQLHGKMGFTAGKPRLSIDSG